MLVEAMLKKSKATTRTGAPDPVPKIENQYSPVTFSDIVTEIKCRTSSDTLRIDKFHAVYAMARSVMLMSIIRLLACILVNCAPNADKLFAMDLLCRYCPFCDVFRSNEPLLFTVGRNGMCSIS